MPTVMMPQQPQVLRATPQPAPQPSRQPTQWQQAAAPSPPPSVVRGVAGKEAPKFVLPRPEALGVATSLPATPPVQVDWNEIQARLAKINALEYRKVANPAGGVHVTLSFSSATQRQQVDGRGDSEAAAILSALQQAEARRGQ